MEILKSSTLINNQVIIVLDEGAINICRLVEHESRKTRSLIPALNESEFKKGIYDLLDKNFPELIDEEKEGQVFFSCPSNILNKLLFES